MSSSFHLFKTHGKVKSCCDLKEPYQILSKKFKYSMLRDAGIFSFGKREQDIDDNVTAQVKHKGKDVHSHPSRPPTPRHGRAIRTLLMLLLSGWQRGLAWRRVLSSRSATICQDSASTCCSLLTGELLSWRRHKVSQSYETIFLDFVKGLSHTKNRHFHFEMPQFEVLLRSTAPG